MRTCPRCGREYTDQGNVCDACAARTLAHLTARRYLISALVLFVVVAFAIFAHSLFRSRLFRPPSDFLPTDTCLALGADLRPNSSAMRHLRDTWSPSDVDHVVARATDIAQELVHWTGVQLDLREDASRWFGGELIAAALGPPDGAPGSRFKFVLVARVSSLRRARRSFDRAVEPLAREADWTRSVIRSPKHSVVTWRTPLGEVAIAYAAHEGCLVVGTDDIAVESCLRAAADPAQRLIATERFSRAFGELPDDSLIWCYASLPQLRQQLVSALPQLRRGWLGLLDHYRRGAPSLPGPRRRADTRAEADSGALALAVIPEPDGIRVHGSYSRSQPREPLPLEDRSLLAEVLPGDVAAYAFIHQPLRWLAALEPPLTTRHDEPRALGPWPPLSTFLPLLNTWLGLTEAPDDLLLALLPRDDPEQRPALIAALPNPGAGPTPQTRLPRAFPAFKEQIGEVLVLAADAQALDQCRRAASDPDARLRLDLDPDAHIQAWASPARLSPLLANFGEVKMEVRDHLAGGEGELLLEVNPRHLLGGR